MGRHFDIELDRLVFKSQSWIGIVIPIGGEVYHSERQVSTAKAAEITGVGYEAFRGWLKRGLMKRTGAMLAPLVAPDHPGVEADYKRWKWSAFGFADLCAFRLMKLLLDAGLPWAEANGIASDNELWRRQRLAQQGAEQGGEASLRWLSVHRPADAQDPDGLYQYCLYTAPELAKDLQNEIVSAESMTLIDLTALWAHVVNKLDGIDPSEPARIQAPLLDPVD